MNKDIVKRLQALSDKEYKNFHGKLIPDISDDRIIGVRIPQIRRLAKELVKEGMEKDFINTLPHYYYEENNLHAFVIAEIRDFDSLMYEIERFLPFIDNWATCDSLRPKAFYKNREALLPYAEKWMKSDKEFTVRFGIEVMMNCFLDEHFRADYPRIISEIKSDKYYVNMMIAWYFATALAKHRAEIMPYIENNCLPEWVHNKTISKAIESYRIPDELKSALRKIRR